jgi:hypothetical protein
MNAKRLVLLGWLCWSASLWSARAAFVLVDGFEAMETGALNGQRGWTSLGGRVDTEPGNPNNQVLLLDAPNIEAYLPLTLSSYTPSTVFFRVRVEVDNSVSIMPVLNWSAGFSGGSITNLPSQIGREIELRQNRDPDNFYPKRIQAREGDAYYSLPADLYPQIWYSVWIVTSPWNNTYQVYLEGGQYPMATRLTDITGKADFALPAGSNIGQLRRWHLVTGSDHAAPMYLDDLYVDGTGQNLSKPPPAPVNPRIGGLAPADDTRFYPAADGIGCTISTTTTNQISATNIHLTLNGVDVSAHLVIQGTPSRRTVNYTSLVTNELYHAQIVATDDGGRQTTVPFVFDTFVPSQIINWEAEHYNFERGQSIENPVLTQASGTNSYVDRVAVEGIDVQTVPVLRSHVYRSQDLTGTLISEDPPRTEYLTAGVNETDVGPFEFGEWLNYTHTFPLNYYRVYARAQNDLEAPVSAQLEVVTGPANNINQTAIPVGLFETVSSEATNYFYVPLADGLGSPIAIKLEGTPTLRITSRSVGFRLNYLLFVPSPSTALNTPFLSSVYPRPWAVGIMPDVTIELVLTDRDTQVDTNTIRMKFGAREVTSALSIVKSGITTVAKYTPPTFLNPGANHLITFIYGDNGKPPYLTTNVWSFSVTTNLTILPASFARPPDSGRTPGFTSRVIQAAPYPVLPDTFERAEYQLAGLLAYAGQPIPPETQSLVGLASTVNFMLPPNLVVPEAKTGNFTNDYTWPGINNHANNLAAETVTYLALNRGSYRFGIHCDDSFRLTAGRTPHEINLVMGSYQGFRAAADTQFDFLVETNGIYAFRLVWEQGTGDGNLEWFSVDRKTHVRTLINDTASPGCVAAYHYAVGLTNPLSIAVSPTNAIRAVNQKATLSVQVVNQGPFWVNGFYQWQSNQVNISGANSAVYTTPPLTMNEDGLKYRCVITVPGYRSLTSTEGVLTVVNDTNPPVIVRVEGNRKFNRVKVSFSEVIERTGAENTANYRFAEGLAVLSASLDDTRTNVFLETSLQEENTPYTLIVNGIQDRWELTIQPETKVRFTSFVLANGFLAREIFYEIPGSQVSDLTSSTQFERDQVDELAALTSFEIAPKGMTNYGQRIVGYLTAPETGDFVFRLSAADSAELWLSKDEVLTNTALIARVLTPTQPYQWTNEFFQISGAITLIAGQRYYLEVLHKVGTNSDHVEVAWTLPSRSGASNAVEVIPGDYLSTYVNPDVANIVITRQPTNVTVPEFRSATFTVVAAGTSALGTNIIYQWLKNGANLDGATQPSYTTPPVKADDNQSRFHCMISVPGKTVFSRAAILTVVEPSELPALFIIRKAQEAIIGWISSATNLLLESNINLMTTNWYVAPEPVTRTGNTNLVVTPAIDTRFFRLRLP